MKIKRLVYLSLALCLGKSPVLAQILQSSLKNDGVSFPLKPDITAFLERTGNFESLLNGELQDQGRCSVHDSKTKNMILLEGVNLALPSSVFEYAEAVFLRQKNSTWVYLSRVNSYIGNWCENYLDANPEPEVYSLLEISKQQVKITLRLYCAPEKEAQVFETYCSF